MTNGARIQINCHTLLKMLDFEGGTIHSTELNYKYGQLSLFIEHPDLPELVKEYAVPEVTPIYTAQYGEDGSIISIQRTDPPKLSRTD